MNNPLLSCDCGNPECPTPFFQGMEAVAQAMGFSDAKLCDMLLQWVVYTCRGEGQLIKDRVDGYVEAYKEYQVHVKDTENESTH